MSDWFDAEEHVERAHEHYEAGRWAEAESELRYALSLHPDRADWHFNLGLTLDAAGKHEDALQAFRDAHDLDPAESSPMLAIGAVYLRMDKVHDAIRWFEQAARAKPDRQEAYVHLIDAYTRLERHDDAETAFYQALHCRVDQADQRPENTEDSLPSDGVHPHDLPPRRSADASVEHEALAYAHIAESLSERGQLDRAIWCLREALRLSPDLPRSHSRLADLYAETGKLERARQLYLRELRASPGDLDTLLGLGRLLVRMNRLGEASEKFRRILEIESDHPDAHFELAGLAEREGRVKEAIAGFRLVLRLDTDYPGVRRRLAGLLIKSGERDAAAALLLRDLRDAQRDIDSFGDDELDELGELLASVDRPEEASIAFRWLSLRHPQDPDALHRFGASLLLAGNRIEGSRAERRAVLLSGGAHLRAIQNLAIAAIDEGRWGRARILTQAASELDHEDAGSRRLRARLRLHSLAWAATLGLRGAMRLVRLVGRSRAG
ncbi:MAG: tetratricopeptide repeat protein [Phycisphaeraceae bacterium]|nr:tetratricopeptide repeat protein [Phycisphaeraceae bacterium]